eukprot:jgi/Mesen1/3398/ME000192S02560
MWTHLVAVYLICIVTFWLLWLEYDCIAQMRTSFMANAKRAPDQFSVRHLTQPLSSQPKKTLGVLTEIGSFSKCAICLSFVDVERCIVMHPMTYLEHHVVYNANSCATILKQRDNTANKLQRAMIRHNKFPDKETPRHKTGFMGVLGERVESIPHYSKELNKLNGAYEKERQRVLSSPDAVMPAAFVTFKSRWGAAVASQTQHTANPYVWVVEWAPEPRDVYWSNLAIPHMQLWVRQLAMSAASLALCFFYMVPVSFAQSLAELGSLSKLGSWMKTLVNTPGVKQFINGFLPGLVLKLFLVLLPYILFFFASVEGHISFSRLQREASSRYFYFLIVNGFFGTVLTGSVLQQINSFISNPKKIPNLLGAAIPAKATFFMTFCMVDGWASLAWEILRPLALIIFNLRSRMLKTERDRRNAMDPGPLPYIQLVPKLIFYLMLGLIYATISPLLLPYIIIYFLLGYAVWRNQIMNVYEPTYESNGQFWPFVHRCIIASLVVMQLTLIGVFLLKSAKQQTPFLVPLPFLTLMFHKYCADKFHPAFAKYPLESAMMKDTSDKVKVNGTDMTFLESAYLHPALKSMDLDVDSIDLEHVPHAPQLGEDCSPRLVPSRRTLSHSDSLSKFLSPATSGLPSPSRQSFLPADQASPSASLQRSRSPLGQNDSPKKAGRRARQAEIDIDEESLELGLRLRLERGGTPSPRRQDHRRGGSTGGRSERDIERLRAASVPSPRAFPPSSRSAEASPSPRDRITQSLSRAVLSRHAFPSPPMYTGVGDVELQEEEPRHSKKDHTKSKSDANGPERQQRRSATVDPFPQQSELLSCTSLHLILTGTTPTQMHDAGMVTT